MLLNSAGQDATEGFNDIGHSTDAKEKMKKYLIGKLDSSVCVPMTFVAESGVHVQCIVTGKDPGIFKIGCSGTSRQKAKKAIFRDKMDHRCCYCDGVAHISVKCKY